VGVSGIWQTCLHPLPPSQHLNKGRHSRGVRSSLHDGVPIRESLRSDDGRGESAGGSRGGAEAAGEACREVTGDVADTGVGVLVWYLYEGESGRRGKGEERTRKSQFQRCRPPQCHGAGRRW
jgi:hypothetical protein